MNRRMGWLLSLWIACTGAAAQPDLDVYHVDPAGENPACLLPALYFEPDQIRMHEIYHQDLGYIAHQLHLHPGMKVRLRADGYPDRFDFRHKQLSRRRVEMVELELVYLHGIDPGRIYPIYHSPWQYRSARQADTDPLARRRLIVDCVWERPQPALHPESMLTQDAPARAAE
ncbi:MAG: hypothetical protein NW241_07580 [Bacteroidia bacterium]|nr:hypothetical protein [Bacteroidia bacterium]